MIHIDVNEEDKVETVLNFLCASIYYHYLSQKSTIQTNYFLYTDTPTISSCLTEDPLTCDFVIRIMKVLTIYRKWRATMLNNLDSIKNPVSLRSRISTDILNYHVYDILDDYQHLLRTHSTTVQLERIQDAILYQFGGACALSKCKIYQRNNRRNVERTTSDILYDTYEMVDDSDLCVQQKLDVIHCYCLHSFEVLRLTSKEEEEIGNAMITNDTETKDDEFESHDLMIGTISKIMLNKQENLASIEDQEPISSKFMTIIKNDTNGNNNNTENEVISSVYAFSKRFYYWPYFKNINKKDTINGGKVNDWYIPLMYSNFKQELLQNKLSNIENAFWNQSMENAEVMMKTIYIKELISKENHKEYEIMKGSAFTEGHILSVTFYCNTNKLQYDFSATFRKETVNETDIVWKVRHGQFRIWAKTLREVVECFGQKMRKKDKLFHGINTRMMFNEMIARLCGPTSTTTLLNVAINFCKEGMILEIGKYDTAQYFHCIALSDHTNEDELLFIGGHRHIRIRSIFLGRTRKCIRSYVSAIACMKEMISGKKPEQNIGLEVSKACRTLIKHHDSDRILDEDMMYVYSLFNCCSEHISDPIIIDVYLLETRYSEIKSLFMTDDRSWIYFDVLCKLYPNSHSIQIKNNFELTEVTFQKLGDFLSCDFTNSNLRRIQFIECIDGCNNDQCREFFLKCERKCVNWEMDLEFDINSDSVTILCVDKIKQTAFVTTAMNRMVRAESSRPFTPDDTSISSDFVSRIRTGRRNSGDEFRHQSITLIEKRNQYHSKRHKSVHLFKTAYKCAHCGFVDNVGNLITISSNEIFHQCFKTPADKKKNKRSPVRLEVNTISKDCEFIHDGPCLSAHKYRVNSYNLPQYKRKKQKKKNPRLGKKYGSSDDCSEIKMVEIDDRPIRKPIFGNNNRSENSKKYSNNLNSQNSENKNEQSQQEQKQRQMFNDIKSIDLKAQKRKYVRFFEKSDVSEVGSPKIKTRSFYSSINFRRHSLQINVDNNSNRASSCRTSPNLTPRCKRIERFPDSIHVQHSFSTRQLLDFDGKTVYAESFKLNDEQIIKLQQNTILPLIRKDVENYAQVVYNENSSQMKVIFSMPCFRNKVVSKIEKHLGSMNSIEKNNLFDRYSELTFPLTPAQKHLMMNEKHFKSIVSDIQSYGTITMVHSSELLSQIVLKIQNNVPEIYPIHAVEKRLGVLMRYQEISEVMKDLKYPMDYLQNRSKQNKFFLYMMNKCSNGIRMSKWNKKGKRKKQYVLIRNDRLFWKEKRSNPNEKQRQMHLTNVSILVGKKTKAFKNAPESLNADCCFSISTTQKAKNVRLDLSTSTPLECREIVAFLRALQRHFINQANEAKNVGRKTMLTPIAGGFDDQKYWNENKKSKNSNKINKTEK